MYSMIQYSRLVNGKIVPCTIDEWGAAMENVESRTVERTEIGDVLVSTVFLGMDHSFGMGGPQILFESMVFGGPMDQEQRRYATMGEAKVGHFELVDEVRAAIGK